MNTFGRRKTTRSSQTRPSSCRRNGRRPIEFELIAESLEDEDLQLRMTVSTGAFTYRVVPIEALL